MADSIMSDTPYHRPPGSDWEQITAEDDPEGAARGWSEKHARRVGKENRLVGIGLMVLGFLGLLVCGGVVFVELISNGILPVPGVLIRLLILNTLFVFAALGGWKIWRGQW